MGNAIYLNLSTNLLYVSDIDFDCFHRVYNYYGPKFQLIGLTSPGRLLYETKPTNL